MHILYKYHYASGGRGAFVDTPLRGIFKRKEEKKRQEKLLWDEYKWRTKYMVFHQQLQHLQLQSNVMNFNNAKITMQFL